MMNERTKQLWEEATKTTQGNSWEEQTKFIERFAELIVRECADCVDFYTSDGNGPASDVILNHFGVK
jgi:hypothetical protein